jgi:hypothetical protein
MLMLRERDGSGSRFFIGSERTARPEVFTEGFAQIKILDLTIFLQSVPTSGFERNSGVGSRYQMDAF